MSPEEPAKERRQYPRVSVDVPVTLALVGRRGPVPARLVNLSEGGCFFAADAGLKTGWQVSFSFLLPERRLCSAMGTVVRGEAKSGFGVEFTTLNETLRNLVDSLARATDEDRARLIAGIVDAEIRIG